MARSKKLRTLLAHQIPSDGDGALAPKESIVRLITARDEVTRQSNNFLLASLGFAALYSLRAIGLRLDITILDYKVFETPYGLFVFCLASSLMFIVAISRFMDARVFDRYARATCDKFWPTQSAYAYGTFPKANSWLEPTNRVLTELRRSKNIGWFTYSVIRVSGFVLFCFYSVSIVISFHFLVNFGDLSNSAGKVFQFWSVAIAVAFDLIFLISSLALLELDVD